MSFIDCGSSGFGSFKEDEFENIPEWKSWTTDNTATDCFNKDGHFAYGIYMQAVNILFSGASRYLSSLILSAFLYYITQLLHLHQLL